MNINFKGYMEQMLTLIADSALTDTGVPVALADNGTVRECAADEIPIGICTALRDGYATVQTAGFAEVDTKTKIDLGYTGVAANGQGGFTQNASGRSCIVLYSTNTSAGIIL